MCVAGFQSGVGVTSPCLPWMGSMGRRRWGKMSASMKGRALKTHNPESGPLSTGEHRGLGAGVSKVRSLKMDRKVWTETLIEVGRPCLPPTFGVSSTQLLPGSPKPSPLSHRPWHPGAKRDL